MTQASRRIEAAVKPELLVWARESAGLALSEVAAKIRVKVEKIESWERGEWRPTIVQLRKLSNVYKRPLAVFFLPQPPKGFEAMRDFRRLPGEVAGVESAQLRLEIRRARYRRQVALDLAALQTTRPAGFTARASLSEDPEDVAARVRKMLGVTFEMQRGLRTPYDALNAWRDALEGVGVLVFQARGVDLAEMRGFSIAEQPMPAVVANIKDAPRGRVFTLLHELVHLMLHQDGLCDLSDHASVPGAERRVEVFCNHVSGAILVPRERLLAEELVREQGGDPVLRDEVLKELARRFQVSKEVMLRRLLILGRTSEGFYQEKRREFLSEYMQRDTPRGEQQGYAPPHRLAIATAGPGFVRLVLDSYYNERITASDLADYLDVRLKHLPRIEQAVFGRQIEFGVAS